MKKQITMLVIGLALLASCKKLETPTGEEPSTPKSVTKFSEIKTNPNFNWSTEKDLSIKISGLKTMSPVRATLTISSMDGKSIYSGNHLMDESFTISTKVAINTKELKMTFGSITKNYTISGNVVEMDYVIEVPQEGE